MCSASRRPEPPAGGGRGASTSPRSLVHAGRTGWVTPSVTCHGARPSGRPVTSDVHVCASGRRARMEGLVLVLCAPHPSAEVRLRSSASKACPQGLALESVLRPCHQPCPRPREARVLGPAFAQPSWWGRRGHRVPRCPPLEPGPGSVAAAEAQRGRPAEADSPLPLTQEVGLVQETDVTRGRRGKQAPLRDCTASSDGPRGLETLVRVPRPEPWPGLCRV